MEAFSEQDFEIYLRPTWFIDSNSPTVAEFAHAITSDAGTDVEKAIKLYYAVRDSVRYNPYACVLNPSAFRASAVLSAKVGFCVQKSILMAAVTRAVGIPARLGYADVRNHLTTKRLRELMGTDVFVYHGYTELYLDGKWAKATPVFDRSLCERFKVKPLEFDGQRDSIFHPFDIEGRRHMEYLRDHGHFADFPLDKMAAAFKEAYPVLFEKDTVWARSDFEDEAAREN